MRIKRIARTDFAPVMERHWEPVELGDELLPDFARGIPQQKRFRFLASGEQCRDSLFERENSIRQAGGRVRCLSKRPGRSCPLQQGLVCRCRSRRWFRLSAVRRSSEGSRTLVGRDPAPIRRNSNARDSKEVIRVARGLRGVTRQRASSASNVSKMLSVSASA